MTDKYYVSVVDPQKPTRYGFLLGPFDEHEQALARVETARVEAERVDPFSAFYAFGTCKVTSEAHAPGVLNYLLEEQANGLRTA